MNQVRLILTRDELITFLTMLGISTMNGLDGDLLAGFDEHEMVEHLNRGEQSLINRGLLDVSDPNNTILDDALVALVGGSAVPDATFLLSLVNPDGTNDPHYFNATSELLVEHHSPRGGIHQFDYVPDIAALTKRVRSLLETLPPAANAADGADLRVSTAALTNFIERVRDRMVDEARAALVEAGVADSVVTTLLADYTTYPSWVGVVVWNLRSGEPQDGETVMIIGGNGHCWLVENVAEQGDIVRVRQASSDACVQALIRLLEPLIQTYHPST